ncbi:Uncharacterised protein [Serratia marcescens]|nr:Uncharacterised protein [Serratia marcescens]CVB17879.1 Uncharacterised protein [Serratia marcescens]CVB29024.1 Uncharacterised protein [Serratia marcescens]CVB37301.1 Uncharacterised protein [Serratia marcescens]CVB80429.1 Uncharacterised protein [Serratia marcescens]
MVVMSACWVASYYQAKSQKLEGTIKQLESDNSLQANIIVTQALQFQRANEISNAANQYGINTDAATQGKEIEYRTILKKQPTCDLAVPAAIAGGLLDYTHRLRSRAMSADTGDANATGAGATASGTLTYCQAVLWIDPLLAALDKANNQLLEIRRLIDER